MFNRELFKQAVKKSGYKVRYIISQLHMSYPTFLTRVQGKQDFTQSEIVILRDLLKLSNSDLLKIFFDN